MCVALEGLSPTNKPSVPILAIPHQAAGTAAEVTINYVITDEEKTAQVCLR